MDFRTLVLPFFLIGNAIGAFMSFPFSIQGVHNDLQPFQGMAGFFGVDRGRESDLLWIE